MQKLSDIRISTRVKIGFAGMLLLMGILTCIGIHKVNMINHDLVVINDVNSVKQRYAINFRGSVHDRAISVRDVVLLSDKAEIQQELELID